MIGRAALLAHFDTRSRHYEVLAVLDSRLNRKASLTRRSTDDRMTRRVAARALAVIHRHRRAERSALCLHRAV